MYKFPKIEHIDEIKVAIAGRDEFIVAEREGFNVVNYLVNLIDSFPTPNTKDDTLNTLYALRRECRGIKFCSKTGVVLARPYHKFFNVNERDETAFAKIDISQPHHILEKLDGSMIMPLILNDVVRWATKMGLTDVSAQAEVFVKEHLGYEEFARDCYDLGVTPIFEWCSSKQRIVLKYSVDNLILTAIRENVTGEYLSRDEMIGLALRRKIPVVNALDGTINNMQDFLSETYSLEDAEGYVIRFADGHMYKVKGEWYVQIHKTKELLQWEKDVWSLILNNNVDDVKSFMEEADKDKLDEFAELLTKALDEKADELKWVVIAAQDNLNNSKKRFALEIVNDWQSKIEKSLLFSIWDGKDSREVVYSFVMNNLGSSTKVEMVRPLVSGLKWEY